MSGVFVVSGPSGVGKSTIVRRVLERDPRVRFSVSHTTRPKRPGEADGVDYHFVDRASFRALIDAGAFLEHAEYQGNLYGTSRSEVEKAVREGYDLILEVEVQGAKQLQTSLPEAVRIFIEPPSMDALEARLRERKTERDDVVRRRLERAHDELPYAAECHHRICNDSLEKAVSELLRVIRDGRGKAA